MACIFCKYDAVRTANQYSLQSNSELMLLLVKFLTVIILIFFVFLFFLLFAYAAYWRKNKYCISLYNLRSTLDRVYPAIKMIGKREIFAACHIGLD